jgi:hypothetical protein
MDKVDLEDKTESFKSDIKEAIEAVVDINEVVVVEETRKPEK